MGVAHQPPHWHETRFSICRNCRIVRFDDFENLAIVAVGNSIVNCQFHRTPANAGASPIGDNTERGNSADAPSSRNQHDAGRPLPFQ